MKKLLLLTVMLISGISILFCQVAINTDGSTPDVSTILDVKAPNKGVLLPRMNQAVRDQIGLPGSPPTGLIIYQTNGIQGYYYYDGTQWSLLASDNLGNHNMLQNLATNGKYISKLGTNNGIELLDRGGVSFKGTRLATTAETFRVDSLGNLLAIGTFTAPSTAKFQLQGPGTRMMWSPVSSAFRFGTVNSTQWDDVNVGINSFAGGVDCIASRDGAFAFGNQCVVTSVLATAFGSSQTITGTAGFASGAGNVVGGFCGTAMGFSDRANGQGSVAIGYRCGAVGDYSVALGYRATSAGFIGGLALGGYDGSTDSVINTANAQMAARYTGGYRFYTNAAQTLGVSLAHNSTSWVAVSDSTKKEKFVKADPADFLDKLAKLKLGSWNYKGTDAINDRHYGPMAQEIFAAYGKDKLGIIGCDTTLATLDMDGIMMILLQGLEKRTTDQLAVNKSLSNELAFVKTENAALKDKLAKVEDMQQQIFALQQSMEKLKTTEVSTNAAPIINVALKAMK
ncbi:MAG: tail fiber domain-containing protein [Ferruginibacter sp.]